MMKAAILNGLIVYHPSPLTRSGVHRSANRPMPLQTGRPRNMTLPELIEASGVTDDEAASKRPQLNVDQP